MAASAATTAAVSSPTSTPAAAATGGAMAGGPPKLERGLRPRRIVSSRCLAVAFAGLPLQARAKTEKRGAPRKVVCFPHALQKAQHELADIWCPFDKPCWRRAVSAKIARAPSEYACAGGHQAGGGCLDVSRLRLTMPGASLASRLACRRLRPGPRQASWSSRSRPAAVRDLTPHARHQRCVPLPAISWGTTSPGRAGGRGLPWPPRRRVRVVSTGSLSAPSQIASARTNHRAMARC